MGYYYLTFGNVIFDLLLIKVVKHPHTSMNKNVEFDALYYFTLECPPRITSQIPLIASVYVDLILFCSGLVPLRTLLA